MDGDKALFSFADPTKHSIVGPDKKLPGAFNYGPSARGSNAWIDDCDMDSAGGKFLVRGEKVECGSSNILGRDFVRYVNDMRGRRTGEYGGRHRANDIILRTQISPE